MWRRRSTAGICLGVMPEGVGRILFDPGFADPRRGLLADEGTDVRLRLGSGGLCYRSGVGCRNAEHSPRR